MLFKLTSGFKEWRFNLGNTAAVHADLVGRF
jgi:hypothetical protein